MANNCLITKLKGTVSNDNLPIFGKGIMDVYTQTASSETPALIHFAGKGNIVFEIIDGDASAFTFPQYHTFMRKEGNKIYVDLSGTYRSDSNIWFPIQVTSAGHYKVRYDKYTCRPMMKSWDTNYAQTIRINVDYLMYMDAGLGKYDGPQDTICLGEGSLSDAVILFSNNVSYTSKQYDGSFVQPLVTGDVSALLDIADLTVVNLGVVSGISGNISSLTAHTNKDNITALVFANCANIRGNLNEVLPQFPALTMFNGENGAGYTGNLDTIATACIAAGREAGTHLTIRGNMTNVSPNPTASGKTINFIDDGQGGVTYEIV